MRLSQAAAWLGAELRGDDGEFFGVSSDTRGIAAGVLFVALRGPRFDGHDYVTSAAAAGVAALLVEQAVDVAVPQLVVRDSRMALGRLAAAWRLHCNTPLAAVTGSNGKTTVTPLLSGSLAAWQAGEPVVIPDLHQDPRFAGVGSDQTISGLALALRREGPRGKRNGGPAGDVAASGEPGPPAGAARGARVGGAGASGAPPGRGGEEGAASGGGPGGTPAARPRGSRGDPPRRAGFRARRRRRRSARACRAAPARAGRCSAGRARSASRRPGSSAWPGRAGPGSCGRSRRRRRRCHPACPGRRGRCAG